MKKNNEKFGFVAQTLILFAVTVLLLMLLAAFFGDGAKEITPLFELGSEGLPTATMLQFLLNSVIVIALKEFYYSERLFKKLMVLWRTVLMLFSVLVESIILIMIFHWFPLDDGLAWAAFLICFGGSVLLSSSFMIIKTKLKSRQYDELLTIYKEQHEGDKENE